MSKALYLGIIKNGDRLLTSFPLEERNLKSERDAGREAERSLYGWQQVFPNDRLSIERLSARSSKGWEFAR